MNASPDDDTEELSDEAFLSAGESIDHSDSAPANTSTENLPEFPNELEAKPEAQEEISGEVSVDTEEPESEEALPEEDDAAFDVDAPETVDPAEATPAEAEVGDVDESHTTPKQSEPEPVDYESAYNKIMAPFKANGHEIKLDNPDEAVKLMQMGANYTKKMQQLQPNLKLMRMLENNDLLDEQKLNFLIDLDRKDPAAIQKLMHDGKIDPLDLDSTAAPTYQPGDHSVSDQQERFHAVLDDVTSTPTGKDTISMINRDWDPASKAVIYEQPSVLTIINEQRENGIFDQISLEISKQKMLGNLQDLSFLDAYKQIGDTLNAAGKLVPKGTTPIPEQVIETRTAPAKKTVSNGDKAKAASATKASPKPATQSFDPLKMTDEEFMALPNMQV